MTADIGIGANMAIESAVVLCNILQRETKSNLNRHFETSELSALFQEYQDKRHERAKIFMNLSGGVTRMRSYESLWKRIFISRIATLPYMQKAQGMQMMTAFSMAPKLNYAPVQTINEDAEGWKLGQKAKEAGSGAGWLAYALVTSAVGVGLSYAAVLKWGLPQL
jgi:FAD dependent monooxygenase